MFSTVQSTLSSAEICRQLQWTLGTVLEGEPLPKEPFEGPLRIEITAIGSQLVLAISLDGRLGGVAGQELPLDLHCRDWRKVD